MPKGYEVRGNTVRVYFRWNGELCRESLPGKATPATIDMIQRRYGKWIRTDGQDVPEMIEKLLDL